MSVRAQHHRASVERREQLSDHLVRLVLRLEAPDAFVSTGVPDEWVGLIVPGQFQSRYYTVRSLAADLLTLDVVVHDVGLVTEWAQRDVVGEIVTITDPKGSFELPDGAAWLLLVGDITALPAMARIRETHPELPVRVWAEVPDELDSYLRSDLTGDVTWIPGHGDQLASIVEGIEWPEGEGYFWMAGESAQMRAIRKHLMRARNLPSHAYDVMGYWRATAARQPRAVDPGPIYREGRARGLSDAEIWETYDAAQQQMEQTQQ
jgi:NADPH-dependent ferric siderophore reductase